MNQIIEFFSKLFETSDWPPRWICGIWSDFHGWLYIGSDISIWLSYFVIPVIIIWFIQRNRTIPFLPVFWLFGAFILLCGASHLIDAVIFWWPAYRLSALLRFFTAIVSLATVFALIRDLPKLLDLSRRNEPAEDMIEELTDNIAQKDRIIEKLRADLQQLA